MDYKRVLELFQNYYSDFDGKMQKEQNLVRVCVLLTGLSLKETPHVRLPHTKLTFYCNGGRLLDACFRIYRTDF